MVMYGDGENGGSSVYERSGPRQVIISAESSLNPKLYPHTKKLIRTDRKPLFVRPLVLSAAQVSGFREALLPLPATQQWGEGEGLLSDPRIITLQVRCLLSA